MSRYVCTKAVEHTDACTVDPDHCGHWCCKVAYWQTSGGLRLSSDLVPHIRERDHRHPPRAPEASWEKGIAHLDRRRDGTVMPLLDSACHPMTLGQAQHVGAAKLRDTIRDTHSAGPVPAGT